ncbi:hypothetical protein J7E26_11320 [Bacillus sp. ISL-51]|nr:hypothetical protein [Bacillus sp. ISL-51]
MTNKAWAIARAFLLYFSAESYRTHRLSKNAALYFSEGKAPKFSLIIGLSVFDEAARGGSMLTLRLTAH